MGVSPYAMDLYLEKTTKQKKISGTVEDIRYDATVPNFALDDTLFFLRLSS